MDKNELVGKIATNTLHIEQRHVEKIPDAPVHRGNDTALVEILDVDGGMALVGDVDEETCQLTGVQYKILLACLDNIHDRPS